MDLHSSHTKDYCTIDSEEKSANSATDFPKFATCTLYCYQLPVIINGHPTLQLKLDLNITILFFFNYKSRKSSLGSQHVRIKVLFLLSSARLNKIVTSPELLKYKKKNVPIDTMGYLFLKCISHKQKERGM